MKTKVLIAMSGGVDSSVAAYLIKESGYDCIGAVMRLFDCVSGGGTGETAAVKDARAVCETLGIPMHVFDFRADFEKHVIRPFAESYLNGETPNPCCFCNPAVKFGKLLEDAKNLGARYLATGHYARVTQKGGRYLLQKAEDTSKDQSYALYALTQEQLKHVMFPLGGLTKAETRKIAAEQGFINAERRDSQDICFVPDGDYTRIVEQYAGGKIQKGEFLNTKNEVIGRHEGHIHYTIGQRKGLKTAFGIPMYVLSKNAEQNTVTLCTHSELYSCVLTAGGFNWSAIEPPLAPIRIKAKIRYNQKEQWATAEAAQNGNVTVRFDEPQRAIAKGQAVVLYDTDTVTGGGIIQ